MARAVSVTLATGAFPFNQQARLDEPCFSSGLAWLFRVERRHYTIAWFDEPGAAGRRPALVVLRGVDLDGDGTPGEAPTASSLEDA